VHVFFTPDEEIGGPTFGTFVLTPAFHAYNGAFALDEGIASPSEVSCVLYFYNYRK
jgi:hypothetical protein